METLLYLQISQPGQTQAGEPPATLVRNESRRHVAAEGKVTLLVDPSYPHLTTSGRFGRSGIAHPIIAAMCRPAAVARGFL
jgi:hypothetical protein